MRFHSTAGHFELAGDFVIVAAFEQQISNLLFAWPQADKFVLHASPPR